MNPIFSIEGRIGRLEFWLRYAFIPFIVMPLMLFCEFVFSRTGVNGLLKTTCLLALAFLYFWSYAITIVRRLHDVNRPAWHALFVLVPFYNYYLFVYLLPFCRGTVGPNQFGPDPLSDGSVVPRKDA